MYKPVEFLETPKEDVKIWKYMDLGTFLNILYNKTLWFNRSDKFKDKLEGTWPKKAIEGRRNIGSYIQNEEARKALQNSLPIALPSFTKRFRQRTAVSCWHINKHESNLMWDVYSDNGLAIQSTYKRLKTCFNDKKEVNIGQVNYIDFDQDDIGTNIKYDPFFIKDIHYLFENELRAIVQIIGDINIEQETIKNGLSIDVEINELIDNVYISPNTPPWMTDLVKRIVSKFNTDEKSNITVLDSSISKEPLF